MHDMYAEPPNSRTFNDAGFMTSYYVLNNAGIGLACFVSGIFFGLGSLVYTIFNGLWLGLIFGYMATVDPATRSHFYEFVSAHGPFELSGIALAGAAGLRLGLGLVVREGRPWREAMVRSARRAFPIAMVAALFIIAAAPIEGFVSPSGIGLMEKRLIMGACAALVVLYLVGLGARGHHILRQRQATELSDAT